jgi:hypothetical protein
MQAAVALRRLCLAHGPGGMRSAAPAAASSAPDAAPACVLPCMRPACACTHRPPNSQEIAERAQQVIQCNDALREVTLYQNVGGKQMSRTFRYDRVRRCRHSVCACQSCWRAVHSQGTRRLAATSALCCRDAGGCHARRCARALLFAGVWPRLQAGARVQDVHRADRAGGAGRLQLHDLCVWADGHGQDVHDGGRAAQQRRRQQPVGRGGHHPARDQADL